MKTIQHTRAYLNRLGIMATLLTCGLSARCQRQDIFLTAPFASSHASSVMELRNGDLLARWFGGSDEGKPDVAIWGSQRQNGIWPVPHELVREHEIATFNPVFFHPKDGRLWLYYKFGPHPTSWTAGRLVSTDEGVTWSKPEHLPAGVLGPIRTKPLVLSDGIIVSGSSVESYHSWAVWIERSEDNGETWRKIGPITAPLAENPAVEAAPKNPPNTATDFDWNQTIGIIRPSLVELLHNRLRLYARSMAYTGKIVIADSTDRGKTWSKTRTIDVPNPNSGIGAISLHDGGVILAFNDTPKRPNPAQPRPQLRRGTLHPLQNSRKRLRRILLPFHDRRKKRRSAYHLHLEPQAHSLRPYTFL
jgi:predicted neuraminidase